MKFISFVFTFYYVCFWFLSTFTYCKEWCKAKFEVGKSDYAECLSDGDNITKYMIETVPALSSGVNLFSNVSIVLSNGYGLKTKEIPIANETEGVLTKVFAVRNDIGNPEYVHIKTNSENKNWQCKKITVWRGFKYWNFDCIGRLHNTKREATYFLSGNKVYTAYVQTGKDAEAGTTASIEITLLGNEKRSNTKVLHEGFGSGSLKKIRFQASDVGNLEDIILTNHAKNDPWYCDFIKIRSDRKVYVFNVKRWIGHPYESTVKVNIKSDDVEGSAKDIDCHVRGNDLINVDNLPNTLTSRLHIFKVRCPQNCQGSEFSTIEGSSLHPASSSICASAIHDGTISPSGGEIIVTIGSELTNYYSINEKHNNIESVDYSSKSDEKSFTFYTYHLDSIDDIKSDVRIVDAFGKLSSLGRLEIRVNGQWGSVCKKGPHFTFSDDSAKRACKDLGFPNGIYLKESCGHTNGQNYCAGYEYPFKGAGILCSGSEKSLFQCNMDDASNCVDHVDDVMVQCLQFSSNQVIPDGTIRIVDANGSPSTSGVGRLQMFYHGTFGSVCSEGWIKEAEHIACLELGYKGLKGAGFSHHGCSDVAGENLCGPDTERINAVEVQCKGSERNVRDCPHQTQDDIYCSHEEDIVIGCTGEEGDASGIGLSRSKNLLNLEKKEFHQKIELTCFDKIVSKSELSSAPVGSVFLANCPEKCDEETGVVKGTYLYTFDSPICKSAIHAGALSNNVSEDIVISISHKHKNFMGTKRNNIESHSFTGPTKSFQVSIPTTFILNKERRSNPESIVDTFKREKEFSYGSIFDSTEKHLSSSISRPTFQWIAPTGFLGFNGREEDFVDCTNMPDEKYIRGMTNFTFILYFTLSGGVGNWRTLLSHSLCEGISLSIDDENELIIEQNCNPRVIKTGFKPALGISYHIAVIFNKSTKVVSLYLNGNKTIFDKSNLDFTLNGDLVLGRSSKSSSDYFYGNIHLVEVYKYILSDEEIKESVHRIVYLEYVNIDAVDNAKMSRKKKGVRKTIDGRECVGPCQSRNVLNKELQIDTEKILLKCEDDLLSTKFNGKIGSQYAVICLENCTKSNFQVKGSNNYYTPDSSICRAAIHAGVYIPNKKEKKDSSFLLRIGEGLLEYPASRGHFGIISQSEKQTQLRSFSVFPQRDQVIFMCSTDGSFITSMNVGESVTVTCPSHCDKSGEAIYGTNFYSTESAVCKAAIHAGVLTKQGGLVDVIAGEKKEFKGSIKNDISSLDSTTGEFSMSFQRHVE